MSVRQTRRAVLGALLLGTAGCDDGETSIEPPAAVPIAGSIVRAGPLAATLQVPLEEVPPGGTFVVRYQLANLSADTVRLEFACASDVTFSVRDAAGQVVSGGGCLTSVSLRTLPPGGFLVRDFALRAERMGVVPTPLPAGRYDVVAEPTLSRIDGVHVTALPPLVRSLRVR